MTDLELRGERLCLRHVTEADLGALVAILQEPAVARWWGRYDADRARREMLEDPQVNFAISTRGRQPGLDHLGIQVENSEELQEVYARLHKAGGDIIEQGATACCYAKSEKSWIDDPAGVAWETFLTTGESTDYGDGTGERNARVAHQKPSACCVPEVAATSTFTSTSACCNS